MSDLVTLADYQRITRDTESIAADVEAAVDEALGMIQEQLDRFLERGTYTESLPVSETGYVYPRGVPVAEVSASSSAELAHGGWALRGVTADPTSGPSFTLEDVAYARSQDRVATVTYTGGYTYATFPKMLRRLVCRVAQRSLEGGPSGIPAGAVSVSSGDQSVSFEKGTHGHGELESLLPGISKQLMPYRRPTY